MKKAPISLLCGITAIIVTIILYFTILGNVFLEAIYLITLFAIIISESITTAFAYFSNGQPRKVAAAIVSAFLIPYSIILSVVYIVNFPEGYGKCLGLYTIALFIVLLISIIIFRFDEKKTEEDKEFQNAKNNMLMMRKMVKIIMLDSASENFKKELNDIEEKLHFMNDSVISLEDEKIYNALVELKDNIENQEYDKKAAINRINKIIDERKILTARNV